MGVKRPQFSAKFKAGVKYLRHKNGIVYPYNPKFEKHPDYTIVIFKTDVRIQDKPFGYIPEPETETVAEEVPKVPEVIEVSGEDLGPSVPTGKPLVDDLLSAIPVSPTATQLAGGLDIGD